jgi:Flp pilus assembly pilin Flp
MNIDGQRGNVVTEYGIILGLVTVVCLVGVKLVGGNVGQLIGSTKTNLSTQGVKDYVGMKFGEKSAFVQKHMIVNPVTGIPSLAVADQGSGATNATSAEGSTATAQSATQLDDLALSITDPALKDWYAKVTAQVHYLAGAEGDFEGNDTLSVTGTRDSTYTNANALLDIASFQVMLKSLMRNPPQNGDPAQIKAVNTLAANVWNNAQGYVARLNPYITRKGGIDTTQLAHSGLNEGQHRIADLTYIKLVKYTTLQQNVTAAASEQTAGQDALNATLQDATTLQTATTTTAPAGAATP